MTELESIHSLALEEIEQTIELSDLEQLRVKYCGKKGQITAFMKQLGKMQPEERPAFGEKVNLVKVAVNDAINAQKKKLSDKKLQEQIEAEAIDVTLPSTHNKSGTLHLVTSTIDQIVQFFRSKGFNIETGPEIEDDFHNFTALNIPEHHPARAMHDTFYFEPGKVLRTHTSPVQIRSMLKDKAPLAVLCPGKVYRCDSDITHTPMFHQVEGLVLAPDLSFAQLYGLLEDFLKDFFKADVAVRFRPSYFPFTEPSAEVDVECIRCSGKGCRICKNTGWLEVLGCGMVHPNVLEHCNVDSSTTRGFAFGMGVERFAMLKYQANDLRAFFENDLDFVDQFPRS